MHLHPYLYKYHKILLAVIGPCFNLIQLDFLCRFHIACFAD